MNSVGFAGSADFLLEGLIVEVSQAQPDIELETVFFEAANARISAFY